MVNYFFVFIAFVLTSCVNNQSSSLTTRGVEKKATEIERDNIPTSQNFEDKLSAAAVSLTKDKVQYDPAYFSIKYPNGDVPEGKGVCTDVVIRAYRKLGIDLQKEVHVDMQDNFKAYPKIWNLKKTDTNIDHRRVPNLMTFFTRKGEKKPLTNNSKDYHYGDIVTWNVGGSLPHIGILINRNSEDKKRYLVVHNIGNGQEISDCLFAYTLTGHFVYRGDK